MIDEPLPSGDTEIPDAHEPAVAAPAAPTEETTTATPSPVAGTRRRSWLGARGVAAAAILLIVLVGIGAIWWWPMLHPSNETSATEDSAANPAPAAPSADAPPPASPAASSPPAASSALEPQLAARVDRLDQAVAALEDSGGSTNLKSDMDALDQRVTELGHRLDGAVQQASAGPQLAALTDTVKQLSSRLDEISEQLQSRQGAQQQESARVLAVAEIATAVDSAAPYGPALQALRALGDDPALMPELTTLETNQDAPSRVHLEWELAQLPRMMEAPVGEAEGGGFWHRALVRLERMVRIRRTADAAEGAASPASVIAAARTELAGGDLAAAIQSVETLQGTGAQDPAATAVGPWLKRAHARLEVEQASQALLAAATAKLSPSAGAEH